jgi:hypothetical protein
MSLENMKIRACEAAKDKRLVRIAQENSASTSYDLALLLTKNQALARATRWLSIIRRDHGDDTFHETINQFTEL